MFYISRSVKFFLLSCLYTSIVIILFLSLFYLSRSFSKENKTGQKASSSYSYSPDKNDNFNIIMSLSKDKFSSPYAYFLLGFNANREQISVCRIFKQTVLSKENEERIILDECYKKGGMPCVSDAINSYFDSNFTRYISFTNDSITDFFDLFEPTIITVTENLNEIDRKNDIYIKIDKGRGALSSVLLLDFLRCTSFKGGDSDTLYKTADAIKEFITQHRESLLSNGNFLLSNCDTDISALDIEKKRDTINFLLNQNKDNAFTLWLDGYFANDKTEYHLSADSYNKIFSNYSK